MSLPLEMVNVAFECFRTPGRVSIWSERLGRYVCSYDPEYKLAAAEQSDLTNARRPPIGAAFKLVFYAASGGTLLFVLICVVTTLVAGKDPPPLLDKTISSLFDLAKIGFGAVVGLLGGQRLQADE